MWGFWESAQWKPDAAMFRKDWTEKPNAEAWRNLVTKQWMTNLTKKTGVNEKTESSGFLGIYEVTFTSKNGNKTKYTYHLKKHRIHLRSF
ncbi:hypothetical protein [Pedobacter kyonggii]|uniref:GH10 domain-containing protein n=1 Tax=Pedobacter kyonggii TaxID=1926871 RepID=A0A4V2JGR7_9SPHI|nr:hypothetical protein [Pedobacter kyonggii]TBO41720.1 hypothetical protein EYS08_12790 [Pedobacter kyonggii]